MLLKRGVAKNEFPTGALQHALSDRAPAVTVLTCTFNGSRYLDQAIRSILTQTWTDFELLIIDDASTDRTAQIIESYRDHRIRVVHNDTNIGVTKSLNRGLAA